MPKLNITITHHLSQDEALRRSKGLLGDVKTQFVGKVSDLREQWNGNVNSFSFSMEGLSVYGTLIVTPSEVEFFVDLPFAATFFRGKIESTIRDRAGRLLA